MVLGHIYVSDGIILVFVRDMEVRGLSSLEFFSWVSLIYFPIILSLLSFPLFFYPLLLLKKPFSIHYNIVYEMW